MNGLALFAGIGGLELGLHQAVPGYRTLCYVERDAYAAAALVARMEEKKLGPAPIWDDVSSFDGKPWRGVVDLVSGGFPCQDISLAGAGAGLDGERSGLWSEYARIVREIRPRFVFVENVAALASRGLDRVLGDLAEIGFDAEWDLFRAEQVGAPHRRERLFILAQRVPDAQRDAVWDESERGAGRAQAAHGGHAELRNLGEELAHTASGGCTGSRPQSAHAIARQRCEELGDADSARRSPPRSGRALDAGEQSEPRYGELGDAHSGRCEGERVEERAGERSAQRHEPDRHGTHGRFGWPPGPKDDEGWERYLAAGGPEPAIRRGSDGLPDGLEFCADRLRCLGNGVVPQVAELAWRTLSARFEGT